MGRSIEFALAATLLLWNVIRITDSRKPGKDVIVISTNQSHIFKYNLKTGTQTDLVDSQKYVYAVDFDYRKHVVYWSDWTQRKILATKARGKVGRRHHKPLVIIQETRSAGIALDWVHRNLYWTDSEKHQIRVKNLERGIYKVLIQYEFVTPFTIVVDPRNCQGFMYWTLTNGEGGIEKAGLDGSHQQNIIPSDNAIRSLAIDYTHNKIYWIDSTLNTIENANLEGKHRHRIGEISASSYNFDVLGNILYWTEYDLDVVYEAHKCCLDNKTKLHSSVLRPLAVAVYDSRKQPIAYNRCGQNNGRCPHLCLPSPGLTEYSCHCADNVAVTGICNTTVGGIGDSRPGHDPSPHGTTKGHNRCVHGDADTVTGEVAAVYNNAMSRWDRNMLGHLVIIAIATKIWIH